MATYTLDDFLKAAKEQGWSSGNGFSTADWNLAQQNPDAGMTILNAKKGYGSATTDAERAQYNQIAENARSQYGGYTGGEDGTSFYLDKQSPSSFTPTTEKPTFSYDVESDPVYSAYKKQYAREGRRATQDALGSAAAATGGIASSYATAAASQAGDYYASQLSDKVPELYQNAYSRYLNELNQWNTDRSFDYEQYVDEINAQTADRQEALQKAIYGAQYGDYSGLADLGFDTSNIPYEYEKQLAKEQYDYEKQQTEAATKWEQMYNLALQRAALGDYSYLNELVSTAYGRTPTDTTTTTSSYSPSTTPTAASEETSNATYFNDRVANPKINTSKKTSKTNTSTTLPQTKNGKELVTVAPDTSASTLKKILWDTNSANRKNGYTPSNYTNAITSLLNQN